MKHKRAIAAILAILLLLLAANFFIDRAVRYDSNLPRVIDYVKSSPAARERFGPVENIQVRTFSEVAASPVSPPHILYALHVKGDKASGLLEVKVILSPETLELVSIQLGR